MEKMYQSLARANLKEALLLIGSSSQMAREEYEQYAKPVGVTHPTPAKKGGESFTVFPSPKSAKAKREV